MSTERQLELYNDRSAPFCRFCSRLTPYLRLLIPNNAERISAWYAIWIAVALLHPSPAGPNSLIVRAFDSMGMDEDMIGLVFLAFGVFAWSGILSGAWWARYLSCLVMTGMWFTVMGKIIAVIGLWNPTVGTYGLMAIGCGFKAYQLLLGDRRR